MEKEINVNEENEKELETTSMVVANVGELSGKRNSDIKIFTTLDLEKDKKKIFNLESNCDFKLNDCKGQSMRIVDVMIKSIQTKLAEAKINEDGEVQEYEFKKICILIDDQGKSYVTASKLFTLQMARYLEMFGIESVKEGLEIKIIEKPIKNSNNKSLGFELL